jgi:hypothetical protein
MPDTVPVRLSDETAASLKRVAALNGITPAEQMDRAWTWWWNRWGVDLLPDLHATVEALRRDGR